MRPKDGLYPTTPQNAAGIRIEPAPSVPSAAAHSPADTAAAAPPLEPPAESSRAQGFRVGPATLLTVLALHPYSDVTLNGRGTGAPLSHEYRGRSAVYFSRR